MRITVCLDKHGRAIAMQLALRLCLITRNVRIP
jgi:hypothetical protein